MTEWIVTNMGTIVVLLILAAIVGLIIRKMVRDKMNGKSTCGCGSTGTCAHCHGACHGTHHNS